MLGRLKRSNKQVGNLVSTRHKKNVWIPRVRRGFTPETDSVALSYWNHLHICTFVFVQTFSARE